MSSDGDISVAEALQQLKKRARNEESQVRPAAAMPRWPEPPLPKIRKEESSGPSLPPRMLQARPPGPTAPPAGPKIGVSSLTGGPLGLKPLVTPSPQAPQVGPTPPVAGAALNLGGLAGITGKAAPTVPFGPPIPPEGAGTAPALAPGLAAPGLAAAGLAAPAQTKASFEIAQSKVGLLLGKAAATINAIKLISKANIHVEQHTPDEEQARVTIVGSGPEVEKAKQTINALLNGIMNTVMLFQLAGLPPPVETPAPVPGLLPLASATGPMPTATPMPGALTSMPKPGLPGLPGGLSGLPGGLQGGLPGALPGFPAAMPPPAAAIPQETQIQEKLNDYYAQWWTQYATMQGQGTEQGGSAPAEPTKPAAAFDKEALARLAQQASKQEELPRAAPMPTAEATPPVPASASSEAPIPPLVGDLTERATAEVHMLLDAMGAMSAPAPTPAMAAQLGATAPAPLAPAGASLPPSAPEAVPFAAVPPNAQQAMSPQPNSLSGMLNGGFQIKPQAAGGAPRAQKDNDSVLKMLQTMQGNVIQAKIENSEIKQAPVPAPVKPRGPAEALPGFESASAAQEVVRSDPQLEAILHRLQSARPELMDAISREVLQTLQSYTPEQVVEILVKMETVPGYSRGELCGDVGKVLAPRLREFNGTQFTSLMGTFMAWLSAEPGGSALEKARSFYVSASTEMSTRLMEFAPHELNCCLASLMASSFSELRFFAQVGRAALAKHNSFNPSQLTALLSLLAEVRLTHLDLFNAAAQFLVNRTKELRKVDLMRLARTFGKCNIRCDPVCQAIAVEVVLRLKKGGADFKVEDLVECSWILCCLQSYNEDLFRMTFQQLEQMPQVATDSLCQVYEIHLVLESEHKEAYAKYRIDSDAVLKLCEHYKENRRDSRRCSTKTRNDVSNVLKSLVEGTVSANHRTSTGLLVDVAALRKRSSTDGFIHVEIDSAMSVIRALDQEENAPAALLIEGPVALRRRILEKHGLIIVTLRENEWRKLDDSREKRRHLRAQLSALSDVLE